jgi:hypothetical protein
LVTGAELCVCDVCVRVCVCNVCRGDLADKPRPSGCYDTKVHTRTPKHTRHTHTHTHTHTPASTSPNTPSNGLRVDAHVLCFARARVCMCVCMCVCVCACAGDQPGALLAAEGLGRQRPHHPRPAGACVRAYPPLCLLCVRVCMHTCVRVRVWVRVDFFHPPTGHPTPAPPPPHTHTCTHVINRHSSGPARQWRQRRITASRTSSTLPPS